jgi:hypothetical protein
MTYAPPPGWVEPHGDDGVASKFHTRTDCPRVRHPDKLRPVDRPYSAVRCAGCAEFHGQNREQFPLAARD